MFRYLIPNGFKMLASGLFTVSLVLIGLGSKIDITYLQRYNLICLVALTAFAILIICKEKDENEGTMRARYKAVSKSFYFLIFMAIFSKVYELINYESTIKILTTSSIYISFLVYYTFFIKFLKEEKNFNHNL